MRTLTFNLFFLSIVISSFGQVSDKWDLRKCVQYAFDHNITIKQQDIQAKIAELTYKQSDLSKYPNLNLSSQFGINTGRSISNTNNLYTTQSFMYNSFNLQSNVELFNWFSKRNTIQGNKLEAEAAQAGVDKLKEDIALNIAAAFLQALLAKDQVNASNIQIQQTKAQLENTRKLVKAGSLPELNQLQLESQLATDSFNYISATGVETQSLLLLKSLLNLDAGYSFDITTPPVEAIPVDPISELQPEMVFAMAMKSMPQQKFNSLRLQAAHKFADAAKGALYPTLSAGANLQTQYSNQKNVPTNPTFRGNETIAYVEGSNTPVYVPRYDYDFIANSYGYQFTNNWGNGVGLGLQIPIFNGNSARTNWQKQKLAVKNLELQRDLDSLTLKQNIYKAYTDALTALQKFNASGKAVEIAQKTFEFSQKRYKAEMLSTIDLIISQNNLFRANLERLSAQYDYVFKMKVLEYYKGQGIKL